MAQGWVDVACRSMLWHQEVELLWQQVWNSGAVLLSPACILPSRRFIMHINRPRQIQWRVQRPAQRPPSTLQGTLPAGAAVGSPSFQLLPDRAARPLIWCFDSLPIKAQLCKHARLDCSNTSLSHEQPHV